MLRPSILVSSRFPARKISPTNADGIQPTISDDGSRNGRASNANACNPIFVTFVMSSIVMSSVAF